MAIVAVRFAFRSTGRAAPVHPASTVQAALKAPYRPFLQYLQQPISRSAQHVHQTACHRIRYVIVRPRRVVDGIPATPRRSTLKAHELRKQAVVVEKLNLTAVQARQQIRVEIALWFCARLIGNPVSPKGLTRPFSRIAVPLDLLDAIALKQLANSLTTSSGLNGARRSRMASSTPTVRSRWPIASVMMSDEPPDGSTKAV